MTDVVFYEVLNPIDFVLKLAIKIFEQNQRTIIITKDEDFLKNLDDLLWTSYQLSFIPHATCFDQKFNPLDQSIWLSLPPYDNKNNADIAINVSGCADIHDDRLIRIVECYTSHEIHILNERKKKITHLTHWQQDQSSWKKIA